MQGVSLTETVYGGFGKCIRLSNEIADLVVTVDAGPRIIRYGFCGMQNELCDNAPMTLPVEDGEWRLMGGHRLLHSPEMFPRTYEPDNLPAAWEAIPNGVRVTYAKQRLANIKKEMEITLFPDGTKVSILHRLVNENAWTVELAPWACTVMTAGGLEIIPQEQNKSHFKEGAKGARFITLWPYTDMGDTRIHWGSKYITVNHDKQAKTNLKIGLSNRDGWAMYLNKRHLFLVRYAYVPGTRYPDNGCSFETFSCDFMTELETLSPLVQLMPGEETTHTEQWELFGGVELKSQSEDELDRIVCSYIKNA